MKPLFEVGEEVILQSKDFPYLSGDALVLNVLSGGAHRCSHCGKMLHWDAECPRYYLDIKSGIGCCSAWNESALRKKPKPSPFSFKEIMDELTKEKVYV